MREGRFCAILWRTARKSLILNGEMSEWLKEHAWKACDLPDAACFLVRWVRIYRDSVKRDALMRKQTLPSEVEHATINDNFNDSTYKRPVARGCKLLI